MRGVPQQHTYWMCCHYARQHSHIIFDDYTLELFEVDGGLNQGNPHSSFTYLVYNSGLVEIPHLNKDGTTVVIYVDDDMLIMTRQNFRVTHTKITDIIQRPQGISTWATHHNTHFGLAKCQLLN
ncbi:hypothetical protein B0H10DRAFT_1717734, partial [Mycena sp. CBHHK59/15]